MNLHSPSWSANQMDASYDIPFPHPRHCPTRFEALSSKVLIDSLDKEIESLQRKVDELQVQLGALRRRRDNHASYLSPFRCLPSEVLGYIVQLCLQYLVEPATLMQTCGTIREVVTGLGLIWSKIALCETEAYEYTSSVS
jgi:hypothetical protein